MCNPANLTARYLDVLQNHLGLTATAPEELDGAVTFVAGGYTCILHNYAPHDPEYVELSLGLGFEEGEFNPGVLSATADRITRRMRLLTVLPTEQGLIFSLSSVLAPPNTLPSTGMLIAVIPRFVHALFEGLDLLNEDLKFYALTSTIEYETHAETISPTE